MNKHIDCARFEVLDLAELDEVSGGARQDFQDWGEWLGGGAGGVVGGAAGGYYGGAWGAGAGSTVGTAVGSWTGREAGGFAYDTFSGGGEADYSAYDAMGNYGGVGNEGW